MCPAARRMLSPHPHVCPDASTQALMAQLVVDARVLMEAAEKVEECERKRSRLEQRVAALKKAIEILA